MKIADIDGFKTLGRCHEPHKVLVPFLLNGIIREPYVNGLSWHILTVGVAAYCGIPWFY
ncbi:MAG: hypothetical protein K2P44_16440 [Lachnospiraceae bacterium]|nr:hypothetical protein [Lachnospiraceae bacterium]